MLLSVRRAAGTRDRVGTAARIIARRPPRRPTAVRRMRHRQRVQVDPGFLVLLGAGALAYVVRGITGGASAIVFNALFGLALAFHLTGGLGLLDGLVWVALGDLVTGFILLVVLRREIRMEPFLRRFLATSLPFSIAITLLLPRIEVRLLALGLGAALVLAGLYLVTRRTIRPWDEATLLRRAGPWGVGAGILSGLYGMAGPVTVVFLAHAGGDPSRFRARLTTLSVFWSTARVGALLAAGLLDVTGVVRFGLTVPAILVGLGIGYLLHPHVGPGPFRVGLGATVATAGILLVLRTLGVGG